MTLSELLAALKPAGSAEEVLFPSRLLGAFRRKTITFCTGETDEATLVFWFQSASFTIDLRLSHGNRTPLAMRQGWIGDTLWDRASERMSWMVDRSYQPQEIWPEPAELRFIGNSVLEFAPSGAYVEDWRQLANRGPLLGLRLVELIEAGSGQRHPMDGGLVIAGEHMALARSRLPHIDARIAAAGSVSEALEQGLADAQEVESYEVSVALDGASVMHSTQPWRVGQPLIAGSFEIGADGSVTLTDARSGDVLRFVSDIFLPDFRYAGTSPASAAAVDWIERQRAYLMPNGRMVR